jgi:hypothetical protein
MHRKRTTAPDGIRGVMGPPTERPVKAGRQLAPRARFVLSASARHAREPSCVSQRPGCAVAVSRGQDNLDGDLDVGAPPRVNGDRASASPGPQPCPDALAVEQQRRAGAARVAGPRAMRQQWPVRDADGRHIEGGPEVQRQPCSARMIASGRIHEYDVGHDVERPNRGLEQWAFAQRQQPRPVRRGGRARDHRVNEQATAAQHRGRRPRRVPLCTGAVASAREAHDAGAHLGRDLGRPPRCRLGRG